MNTIKHCNQHWKHEAHNWHAATQDGVEGYYCDGSAR